MNNNILKYILVIVIVSIAVYANSLNGEFVSDDIPSIIDNPLIHNPFAVWHLQQITNSLIYKFFGLNPIAYHALNVLIHAINGILVFFLLKLFFDARPSLFGALIFAVHPIHTEAISWISGRSYALGTTFLLCSFLLYQSSSAGNKIKVGKYIFSLLFHIASVFTAWYGWLYPGMLMLYDITYKRYKKTWKLWIPFIAAIIAWWLTKNFYSSISDRLNLVQEYTGSGEITNPIFNIAWSIFNYAKLLLCPTHLVFYRELNIHSKELLMLTLCVLALIIFISPVLFKKSKPLFFALGIFVLFLSPTYSPISIVTLLAERYCYLPSIGFCMLVAFILQRYMPTDKLRKTITVLLVIVISAYSIRTIIRNNDWRDNKTFWQVTIKDSLDNPKGYKNLAGTLLVQGNPDNAIILYKKALELKPDFTDAYNDLAAAYTMIGENQLAIENYKKALEINPSHPEANANLGSVYYSLRNYKQAIAAYEKALKIKAGYKSYYVKTYDNLGTTHKALGNYQEAIIIYNKLLEINPRHVISHNKLAILYYETQQYALAIQHCNRAIELGINIHPQLLALLEPYRKKDISQQ